MDIGPSKIKYADKQRRLRNSQETVKPTQSQDVQNPNQRQHHTYSTHTDTKQDKQKLELTVLDLIQASECTTQWQTWMANATPIFQLSQFLQNRIHKKTGLLQDSFPHEATKL